MNFGAVTKELLREYGYDANDALRELLPEAADQAVKGLRQDSRKRTGMYAKDWASKAERVRGYSSTYIVYNRQHYRVAHLLENDHPFRNQYGTTGSWKGDGRIAEVEEYTFAWLESELTKRLEKL
jgi:hypothetical protein